VRRFKFVSPGYFGTLGRRFLAGRDFTWTDIYGDRNVTIVSENLAREYWQNPAAALGKRIREGMKDDWREIVGVVANEYDDGVQKAPPATAWWPFAMKNFWGADAFIQRTMAFDIRSSRTGSAAFLDEVRSAVWSVAPNSPLANVQTLDHIYALSMARTSFTLTMLAIAGVMALLLGLIGIYGVISYSVSQRRREIGIRVALGARERQVSALFVRHGLLLAAIGTAFGLVAAFSLRKVMDALLFGVAPSDPVTYAAMSVGLIAAAALASYIPARRAAAVNPVDTLRSE
jgi:predicted permease